MAIKVGLKVGGGTRAVAMAEVLLVAASILATEVVGPLYFFSRVAQIKVDGSFVGVWQSGSGGRHARWLECESRISRNR